jgi:hypothetical protein
LNSNLIYDIFVLAVQFAFRILAVQLEKGLFECLYMFAIQIVQNTNLYRPLLIVKPPRFFLKPSLRNQFKIKEKHKEMLHSNTEVIYFHIICHMTWDTKKSLLWSWRSSDVTFRSWWGQMTTNLSKTLKGRILKS